MVGKIAVMFSAFMSMMSMNVEAASVYISSNLPNIGFRYYYPTASMDETHKTSKTYDSANISEPSYFLCTGNGGIQRLYFDDSNQTRTFTAPNVSGKVFLGWYGVGGSKSYAPEDGYKYPSDFNALIQSGHELTQQTLWACVKNGTVYSGFDFMKEKAAPIRAKYRDLYKYTITYKPGTNGSGSQQTQSKTENANVTLKGKIFTRTGYTQTGWATSDGGSKAYNLSATYSSNDNLTLYPVWQANTYTVKFNANGGSVTTASKSVTYNSTYGTVPTPTRTGYTFKGWFTETSGGTQVTHDTKVAITANQTLYARWAANSYTVTFKANGGSVTTTSKSVTYNSTYGELPTPTRTGHTFKGWFTATSGGSQVVSGTKVAITAAQTLYAQWEAEMRTVVFIDSDQTTVLFTTNVAYGTTINTPSSVTMHSGDVFKWWDDGNATYPPGANLTVTENRRYFPVMEKIKTTITASVNPPSAGSIVYVDGHVEETGDAGRVVTIAVRDISPAYYFSGWSDGVMVLTNSVEVITNMHLTANFTMKTNTVEFVGWNGEPLDVQLVPYGGSATNVVPPVCTGLTFVAWTPDDFTDDVTADMTVRALYETNRYTVVYNANGGRGDSMTNDVVLYFSEYQIRSNEYTSATHKFWGWSTNQNATTNEFEYGEYDTVSNLTHEADGIVNLYAVWSSVLTPYSIAADCTNLVLECTDPKREWGIDDNSGYASPSSLVATGKASLTTVIGGPGTLTFRLRARSNAGGNVGTIFGLYTNDIFEVKDAQDEYKEAPANGEWILCTVEIKDSGLSTYEWYSGINAEGDEIHIDQVNWYPGKTATVIGTTDTVWFGGDDETARTIKDLVLRNWNNIAGGCSSSVSSLVIDATKVKKIDNVDETINVSVTNAAALLGLGFAPAVEYADDGSTATLTFTNAPDLAIGTFEFDASDNARLGVAVTNTSWGLPSWSEGVEQILGVWGAPSLTSAWSRVDAECDLSRYVSEGVALFDFDVGTNRFFKVKAE